MVLPVKVLTKRLFPPRFRGGQTVSQENSSWLDYHDSPTAVRSLREGRIHYHIGLRPFTRGLPIVYHLKRSYHERSRYLAYWHKFPCASGSLSFRGFPNIISCLASFFVNSLVLPSAPPFLVGSSVSSSVYQKKDTSRKRVTLQAPYCLSKDRACISLADDFSRHSVYLHLTGLLLQKIIFLVVRILSCFFL